MICRGEKLISNKVKIVRLLNKSKKSLLRGIFSRTTVIAILLILQLLFLLASYSWLEQYRVWLATVEHILTIGAVLYL
ncbi:TPA: cardiolipin synthase, partial [Streptococcus agalactiae]|nr:cardiolipin synthase [Streptococcus agalactiae]